MRTLNEILEAAKNGGPWPSHEECYWAMLAIESQWIWIDRHYREAVLVNKNPKLTEVRLENDFQMSKRLLAADPKVWLGPDRDWSKPENRKRRATAIKLYEKIASKREPSHD
jgi:hypothetical protein